MTLKFFSAAEIEELLDDISITFSNSLLHENKNKIDIIKLSLFKSIDWVL